MSDETRDNPAPEDAPSHHPESQDTEPQMPLSQPERPDQQEPDTDAADAIGEFLELHAQDAAVLEPAQGEPAPEEPEAPAASAEQPAVPEPQSLDAFLEENPDEPADGPQTLDMSQLMRNDESWGTVPLMLPQSKMEELQIAVGDLAEYAGRLKETTQELANPGTRADASESLTELLRTMAHKLEGFEFRSLTGLLGLLEHIADAIVVTPEYNIPEVTVRAKGACTLIEQHLSALQVGMETNWPLDTLVDRTRQLLAGEPIDSAFAGWHNNDPDRVLELDAVTEGFDPLPEPSGTPASTKAPAQPAPIQPADRRQGEGRRDETDNKNIAADRRGYGTPTVRVELAVLDQMLELAAQFVQTKNSLLATTRRMKSGERREEVFAELDTNMDSLDRASADLQDVVLRTRLQPVSKLFSRLPRTARDIANIQSKDVAVYTSGDAVRVEMGTFDAIADPLAIVLRFLITFAVQTPEQRQAGGKDPQANIIIHADDQGSQVVITISDDEGKLKRDAILLRSACSKQQAETFSELDEQSFLDALSQGQIPGSPIDEVLETLRMKVGGWLEIESNGSSNTVRLILPTKSAIISAITARLGKDTVVIPMSPVSEIVRLEGHQTSDVNGLTCIRLRDRLMPLIDTSDALDKRGRPSPKEHGHVVVVEIDGRPGALVVDRVISKHDVVIRPLDKQEIGNGPYLGATVQSDGRVALILDVRRLLVDKIDLVEAA